MKIVFVQDKSNSAVSVYFMNDDEDESKAASIGSLFAMIHAKCFALDPDLSDKIGQLANDHLERVLKYIEIQQYINKENECQMIRDRES